MALNATRLKQPYLCFTSVTESQLKSVLLPTTAAFVLMLIWRQVHKNDRKMTLDTKRSKVSHIKYDNYP